jgi:hypothetical protein
MSALEASLDDSGESDHAQMMRAADLLKEAATILDDAGLLAIRARLQEVLDAIEERASHPRSTASRKDS